MSEGGEKEGSVVDEWSVGVFRVWQTVDRVEVRGEARREGG